jgi:hypothetical protein
MVAVAARGDSGDCIKVKKDYRFGEYQCLIGRQFSVDQEIYVVRELSTDSEQTLVQANSERDEASSRTFFLTEVLERLLVDEEIVLFHPSYLGR